MVSCVPLYSSLFPLSILRCPLDDLDTFSLFSLDLPARYTRGTMDKLDKRYKRRKGWWLLRWAGQCVANVPTGPEKECYCEDHPRCFFLSFHSSFFSPCFTSSFFLLLSFCFFFLCWAMLVFDRLEKIGSRGLKQRCFSDVRWRKEFTLRHVTSGCCLMAEFCVRLWCFKGWLDGIPTGLRVKLFGSANLFCFSEVWDRLMNEGTWIF